MESTPLGVRDHCQLPTTWNPGMVMAVPLPMHWPLGTLSQNSTLICARPLCMELGTGRVTVVLALSVMIGRPQYAVGGAGLVGE